MNSKTGQELAEITQKNGGSVFSVELTLTSVLVMVRFPASTLGSLHQNTESHEAVGVANDYVVAGNLIYAVNAGQPYAKHM